MSNRYIGGVVTETTNVAQSPWSGSWTEQAAMQGFGSVLKITNSLRFRASASAYLNRTPSSASNRQTWTWSGWAKLGSSSSGNMYLLSANTASGFNDAFGLSFASWSLNVGATSGGATTMNVQTTQVFRDFSSWYHIVVAVDTTQATAADRVKIYANGTQVTALSATTYPAQNASLQVNSNVPHYVGALGYTTSVNYDGYMAEVNFIDGQALDPTAFGAINKENGVWAPITYTGTYGLNGFHLDFKNATSTTTLGYDTSGNGNNWTTNNISLTAGSTYDWMIDSPSKIQGTGYGVGNYAVLNPISNPNGPIYTVSNGNLNYSCSASAGNAPKMAVMSSFGMASGKWYCEVTETSSNSAFGITSGLVSGGTALGVQYALVYNGGTNTSAATYSGTTPTFVANDTMGLAFDVDAHTIGVYKNGTFLGTLSGIESSVGTWFFLQTVATGASSTSSYWNFGQRPFAYTPPTGYKTLCTQNLPVATIYNGAAYMAATAYTGSPATSISNTVNGVGFQPDLVWVKSRSAATEHKLVDSVRGATKTLTTINSNAETTVAGGITAFNTTGFSTGSAAGYNSSGVTYVGWQWKAGGTAVTNTSGSITSSVSANTTAGFSVVTYTGTGSSATVGHGLGTAPAMVIVKRRSSPGGDWYVWHTSVYTLYGASYFLSLNAPSGAISNATVFNGNTTATTFPVVTNTAVNGSGGTFVAYCFAAIAGYSAFGSYTGNGSSDGPFVYCGFRPRFILLTNASDIRDWCVWDTSRSPYNLANNYLTPNSSLQEISDNTVSIDALSNGFKIRGTWAGENGSGNTIVYAAFAENPFSVSLAR